MGSKILRKFLKKFKPSLEWPSEARPKRLASAVFQRQLKKQLKQSVCFAKAKLNPLLATCKNFAKYCKKFAAEAKAIFREAKNQAQNRQAARSSRKIKNFSNCDPRLNYTPRHPGAACRLSGGLPYRPLRENTCRV